MEIGLTYSSKDPRHKETKALVRKFVRDRGILARIIESEQPVEVPTITIDGCSVIEPVRASGKAGRSVMKFPTPEEISRALERSIWCL
ncbi:MAG: hypothetical protein KAW91_06810 [candidate division Zixibacteria bacterium]|nr:hypothetical protein [candidate division Zixibacteria bacterium]